MGLKHIPCMLLEEELLAKLSDEDATNLIRLLFASTRKAVLEKIFPASDNKKKYYTKAQKCSLSMTNYIGVFQISAILLQDTEFFECLCCNIQDVFEISKRDITISMMRNYPQLPHKFMSDKAKIHHLLEIIIHMNLERDSLKRQDQNSTFAVLLKKKVFLKYGVKEALRSRVKALNFCATVSYGELQDFALNKFKGIEDELVIKLKSALKEVAVCAINKLKGTVMLMMNIHCFFNLKRLYELQLSRQIFIESLHKDPAETFKKFRCIDDKVGYWVSASEHASAYLLLLTLYHKLWISPGTIYIFLHLQV
ncbi:hypothetical protein H5410_027665 [Solanum commersonii]|uniref:Cohesin subunit SCC3/SA HEAT-repeats domain-containing protein n=1 Tax=Solanum commersonii TaxID=4109 RepID=A0A9J5Z1W4_SOLCO|nr:hypothetical protein H5410_027665 [Solanum commersonii]